MKIERVYGSKADDTDALESLSAAVEMTDNQAREAMVNVILNCVGDLLDVIHLCLSCDICIVSMTSISICFILSNWPYQLGTSLQSDLSVMRRQLLDDFVPEDEFVESSRQISLAYQNDHKSQLGVFMLKHLFSIFGIS